MFMVWKKENEMAKQSLQPLLSLVCFICLMYTLRVAAAAAATGDWEQETIICGVVMPLVLVLVLLGMFMVGDFWLFVYLDYVRGIDMEIRFAKFSTIFWRGSFQGSCHLILLQLG